MLTTDSDTPAPVAEEAPKLVPFEDICGPEPAEEDKAPLDRLLSDEEVAALTPDQKLWFDNGVLVLKKLLPDDLVDEYCELRQRLRKGGGWSKSTPYLFYPQLMRLGLYQPLMEKMKEVLGEDMGLHLQLTGWKSTERNWHQDDYLNPSFVNSRYAAVWMALDDISPDAGPFQYVPGSHKWPLTRGDLLRKHLSKTENTGPGWPKHAERISNISFEEKIKREGSEVVTYIPKRGDVLIWHGRLAHRGSAPAVPGTLRKSLICHYSANAVRTDFKPAVWHEEAEKDVAGHYFDFDKEAPNIKLPEAEAIPAYLD